jgi:catechol 2,3-dioxygenase-like lactoylglutathione lyase family enzyme
MAASVRYIVDDVDAAIAFYRDRLGFRVEMHPAPAFAILAKDDLRLMLSRPGGSGGGGQAMPDGEAPKPGGWNRIQIEVEGLEAVVARLRRDGARFRNAIVTGVGAKQILLEDPSGNLVELFEPLQHVRR